MRTDRAWETHQPAVQGPPYPLDRGVKSLTQCIHMLVACATGDGNLLLGVRSLPNGQVDPEHASRLGEIGGWLRQNGRSIYRTRGGPFRRGFWGGSTYRGNTIYVHILNWPDKKLILPKLAKNVQRYYLLSGEKVIVNQTASEMEVDVPKESRDPMDTILALELDGPVSEVLPTNPLPGSLATGKAADASSVRPGGYYEPGNAFDNDMFTYWQADIGVPTSWLDIDLGQKEWLTRVVIREVGDNIQKFVLKCAIDNKWTVVHSGTSIGNSLVFQFKPVATQFVQLSILKAKATPAISELRLYSPQ
jgi:alpha-L-fucosidase